MCQTKSGNRGIYSRTYSMEVSKAIGRIMENPEATEGNGSSEHV